MPRLEKKNGNINLSKYFISSCGDLTHNQSVLRSHFVPLRHDWPLVDIPLEVKLWMIGVSFILFRNRRLVTSEESRKQVFTSFFYRRKMN